MLNWSEYVQSEEFSFFFFVMRVIDQFGQIPTFFSLLMNILPLNHNYVPYPNLWLFNIVIFLKASIYMLHD